MLRVAVRLRSGWAAGCVAGLLAVLSLQSVSHACSCTEYPTFEEARANSGAIFRGVVQWIDPIDDWTNIVGFEASATWKGPYGPEIAVYTPATEAACGFTFVIGDEYLVYTLGNWNDFPAAYLCWRTHAIYFGDSDILSLGPPRPVAVESVTWTTMKCLFD
jgi:hypothetical protein